MNMSHNQTIAYRPLSSNGFRYPYNLGDPIGNTHYDTNFVWKPTEIDHAKPIRTGTSSGSRANNPHPSREFMVFGFRKQKNHPPTTSVHSSTYKWSPPIGDKLLSQCIRSQMRSIYSSDYVNNVELKAKFEQENASKERFNNNNNNTDLSKKPSKQEYPSFEYNHPFTYESLNIAPTRFGSSRKYIRTAQGILPNLRRDL